MTPLPHDDEPTPRLEYLGFAQHAPHPELSHWPRAYWTLAGPITAPSREYFYPDATVGMLFNFGDAVVIDGRWAGPDRDDR